MSDEEESQSHGIIIHMYTRFKDSSSNSSKISLTNELP